MIVLDKSRALDLMISRAERIHIPAPFHAGFWSEIQAPHDADPVSANPDPALTNLLDGRPRQTRPHILSATVTP